MSRVLPHRPLAALLTLVAVTGCAGTPEHNVGVTTFLEGETNVDLAMRDLTGTWTDDGDGQVLFMQAGELVGVLALGGPTRSWVHFGEGRLHGERLQLLPYRQGVWTEAGVAGVDTGTPREATLSRLEESLSFTDDTAWRRSASIPGTGELTGIWRIEGGGLVAVAHEGQHWLACAVDDTSRASFSMAHGRLADDGRLWTIFVQDGRPGDRKVGRVGVDADAIEWPGAGTWKLDRLLAGAPPAPPRTLSPADRGSLPNSIDGTLTWAFDWTDVAGATEYRLEVVQEARRAFVDLEGIEGSEHVFSRSGGSLARTQDWTWRVAAKVGGAWTEWSQRARFEITED